MTHSIAAQSLLVSEVVGPTVQGDGASAGRIASIIRLGGCNLTCSWCDAAYTWDPSRYDLREELTSIPVDDIAARVLRHDTSLVVLTGGEPLLHQRQHGWLRLLKQLTIAGKRVEVETNGTVVPTTYTMDRVAQFNCSPKLANCGEPGHARINAEVLNMLVRTRKAHFSFVCRNVRDVDEASVMVLAHELPRDRVWISPEGTTATEVGGTLRNIADRALAHRFNLAPRVQALLCGNPE